MRTRRFRLVLLLTSAALLVAGLLLRSHPERVELWFSDGVGSWVARILTAFSAPLPFSLAEVLLVTAGLILAGWVVAGVVRLRRGDRPRGALLFDISLDIATVLVVVLASFYWSWGLNYYRPALSDRVAWGSPLPPVQEVEGIDELVRLSETLIQRTNQEYRAAAAQPALELARLDELLEQAYARVASDLDVPARRFAAAKPLWSSSLLSRLGLAGVYSPWTGEAGFNRTVPRFELPHVIAHEKAHQRGIAAEDEANFAGLLACLAADDASVRYSGLLFAQLQLLSELSPRDPALASRLAEGRLPGVQEDLDEAAKYWRRFRGPIRRMGTVLNDSYLRMQGVEDGVDSYERSTRLIVLYARYHGGRIPLGRGMPIGRAENGTPCVSLARGGHRAAAMSVSSALSPAESAQAGWHPACSTPERSTFSPGRSDPHDSYFPHES